MIKVILADDHDLVRTGLKRLLGDVENITVVGDANNGRTAIGLVKEHNPDIAILDINMPGLNGIETTEILRRDYPELKIVIISMHNDEMFPQRLINAGANAYMTKGSGIEEITYAINEVMELRNYICHEVVQKMAMANMKTLKFPPSKAFQSVSFRF